MMVLHKYENGQRVRLSEEEEALVRAEWAENDKKRIEKKSELDRLAIVKQEGIVKLADLGLSAEEIQVLFGLS
jgi:hypothetical protein